MGEEVGERKKREEEEDEEVRMKIKSRGVSVRVLGGSFL